jgi:hypothetical protein
VNFLQRILNGVRNFLQINLARDIECIFWHSDVLYRNELPNLRQNPTPSS